MYELRQEDLLRAESEARQRGMDVTLIAPEAVPLERVLGPEVGAVYLDFPSK